MPLCGGTGEERDATPEVQNICDEVKPHAEEKAGKQFDTFTAVKYSSQVVAGTNYFIKVHVGEEEYMHLRVHKSLPHDGSKRTLHSIQSAKTKHDPIGHF
ncbi:cystatin-B-like [Denticeps clupeoides]|uniref:Cystatin-B n=1 Tax=Denticeps clupeoides TaxID=299321 RepID=A0AAY4BXN1_9TELE|nr:cystatin-B-like [Denticeps clupeoides]